MKERVCIRCKKKLTKYDHFCLCQSCQTKFTDNAKIAGKAVASVAGVAITAFLAVLSRGKYNGTKS